MKSIAVRLLIPLSVAIECGLKVQKSLSENSVSIQFESYRDFETSLRFCPGTFSGLFLHFPAFPKFHQIPKGFQRLPTQMGKDASIHARGARLIT
jgi:hypothetical protein